MLISPIIRAKLHNGAETEALAHELNPAVHLKSIKAPLTGPASGGSQSLQTLVEKCWEKNPVAYAIMDGCLRSITILNTYESGSPRLISIGKAVI